MSHLVALHLVVRWHCPQQLESGANTEPQASGLGVEVGFVCHQLALSHVQTGKDYHEYHEDSQEFP